MAIYGKLSEFQPETESIAAYLERVEVFYKANSIAEDKQVAVFLSVVGGKTFSLLRDLLAPAKPQDQTLATLFETLKLHFEPKPLVIAERFYFHKRNQGTTESIAEYLAELRRLATNCEFGGYLNDALRDRLVCGLRNNSIQKRLLSEANLTLAKAGEIAQGMEAAERNAKRLQGGEGASVYRMAPHGGKPSTASANKPCYRCGGTDHAPSACRFRDATCHQCQKKGHIAKVCRSGRTQKRQRPQHRRQQPIRKVDQEPVSDREDEDFTIFKVGGQGLNPIVVTMGVNGQQLTMEVDTGAAVSVISDTTQAKLFPKCRLDSTSAILTTYTGEQMPVVGQMKVEVSYQKQSARLTLYVVKGQGPSLLGRDWLRQIRLDWKSIGMASLSSKTEALVGKFPEVFEEGLGLMNTFEASLHLKPEYRPKFHKARPVPFALKQAIDRELDRLEGEGIIDKVSHSHWAAPVVPVPKGDGQIRLCGDYKVTINPVLEVDQYKLRARLVEELHRDHPGVTRMKAVARSYLWWPGLDKELEECARSCLSCQAVKSAPAVAPLHPWLWPAKPWQRVHVDFAGPFLGKMFLIVVDAYSKWPEVVEMTSTEAPKTICELRKIFAANGLPEQLVSDNGPQFVSSDFAAFMKMNGIKHIRCAPYHPSSNGAAERFVQTFKRAMKAGEGTVPLSQRLSNFLLTYRSTPHATTNEAPSQLLMGRKIRTRLDLLRPDSAGHVSRKQAQQKADHDKHARSRELYMGQSVMVRNLRPGAPWVPGVIVRKLGPLSYQVQVNSGQLWKRHLDHLRVRSDTKQPVDSTVPSESDWSTPDFANQPTENERPSTEPPVDERRYPQRERRAPDRYV